MILPLFSPYVNKKTHTADDIIVEMSMMGDTISKNKKDSTLVKGKVEIFARKYYLTLTTEIKYNVFWRKAKYCFAAIKT